MSRAVGASPMMSACLSVPSQVLMESGGDVGVASPFQMSQRAIAQATATAGVELSSEDL
jgi:hypothetical protein